MGRGAERLRIHVDKPIELGRMEPSLIEPVVRLIGRSGLVGTRLNVGHEAEST